MYGVGEVKRKAERLMDVTYEAMMAGIAQVKPGNRFGDIGGAISEIARKNRMSVVEDFCGHGLGRLFHDEPNVIHSADYNTGPELKPGMFFTIEPMLNLGRKDANILPDGWTAVTRDRQLSAQYEHSVGVTEDGVEIFTTSPKGWHQPHKVAL
jgi:methionyl aminopeptidase